MESDEPQNSAKFAPGPNRSTVVPAEISRNFGIMEITLKLDLNLVRKFLHGGRKILASARKIIEREKEPYMHKLWTLWLTEEKENDKR